MPANVMIAYWNMRYYRSESEPSMSIATRIDLPFACSGKLFLMQAAGAVSFSELLVEFRFKKLIHPPSMTLRL